MDKQLDIVAITRKNTKTGKPMLKCRAETGEVVFAFWHKDKPRDTFGLFLRTDGELVKLADGETLHYTEHPVKLSASFDGEWWRITDIAARPKDLKADPPYQPNVEQDRQTATAVVSGLFAGGSFSVFDVEVTSFDPEQAEIVRYAVVEYAPGHNTAAMDRRVNAPVAHLSEYVLPLNMAPLTAKDKNGVTPAEYSALDLDEIQEADPFPAHWAALHEKLYAKVVVGWNIDFDLNALRRDCERHGLEYPEPLQTIDLMKFYGPFQGTWNSEYNAYKWHKLSDAAAFCLLPQLAAHDPLNDCLMTLYIAAYMAGRYTGHRQHNEELAGADMGGWSFRVELDPSLVDGAGITLIFEQQPGAEVGVSFYELDGLDYYDLKALSDVLNRAVSLLENESGGQNETR